MLLYEAGSFEIRHRIWLQSSAPYLEKYVNTGKMPYARPPKICLLQNGIECPLMLNQTLSLNSVKCLRFIILVTIQDDLRHKKLKWFIPEILDKRFHLGSVTYLY